MSGVWLVSYVVLWTLGGAVCVLLLALLQQIGLLRAQSHQRTEAPTAIPTVQEDGPPVGSRLPHLTAATINERGIVTLAANDNQRSTLLMFMSPMCEGCQNAVSVLNALVEWGMRDLQMVVILRADHHASQAFLHVFPLQAPTIGDSNRAIHMAFNIHRAPFGLLYDRQDTLVSKGVVVTHEELLALFNDVSEAVGSAADRFPPASLQAASV